MAVALDEAVEVTAVKALRVLRRYASVSAAFILGSQVEGRSDADSDIDLAVFVDGGEHWGIHQRARVSAQVQREVGDHIELHFFPATALSQSERGSFAAHVQEHGIRIGIVDGNQ